ncbi:MAG: D-alanyl transfer protein [Spirochaetia bacterium]|nr:D-alanyl transfer protein [Spirochaetia bacterium]
MEVKSLTLLKLIEQFSLYINNFENNLSNKISRNILPFTELKYFIIIILVTVGVVLIKKYFKKFISYSKLIFFLTLLYIIILFPQPIHALLFIVYIYFIYKYLVLPKKIINILGILLVALPMVLVKFYILIPLITFIGLSYITFRTVQLIIDSQHNPEMNIIDFVSFLLFPPTLLAGPIDRSYRFANNIENGYDQISTDNILSGWRILLIGVLQKFIIAKMIDDFWIKNIDENSTNLKDMISMMYGYSIYFYFDFAGYSSMAIGSAKMIGINIPENFNYPFLSKNPQEFWRRFHITLGSWLKDYFFKPIYMYLYKFKKLRKYRLSLQNISLIITFLLMGMWNGIKFHFILSGFMFGIYSAVHNSYRYYLGIKGKDSLFNSPKITGVLSAFILINFVVLALYVFSAKVPYLKDIDNKILMNLGF